MASEVEICNMALGHIRAGEINSLDESSQQARKCKLMYPILRDQLLEDSPWQFASAVKPLSELDSTFFNWAHVYQYPYDCLRVNRIIPNVEKINSDNTGLRDYGEDWRNPDFSEFTEYKVYNQNGNQIICSNHPELRIDYRVKVTDPNLFSINFTLALSHLLAAEMAIPLAGVELGVPLSQTSLGKYRYYLNAGIVNELNEQKRLIGESEYIEIRK